MSRKENKRAKEIHHAVSHGALEHVPEIAKDVMFLCEYTRKLERKLEHVRLTGRLDDLP